MTHTKTQIRTRRLHFVDESGQAIVEFVLVLPILAMLFVGIWQFGVAFHDYLTITDAARVGARAAAVSRVAGSCAAASTAIQSTVSATQWSTISTRITCTAGTHTGDPVTITITYPYSVGYGSFGGSGDMTASATERVE
jgi:Flp pilus assembly protein TadG